MSRFPIPKDLWAAMEAQSKRATVRNTLVKELRKMAAQLPAEINALLIADLRCTDEFDACFTTQEEEGKVAA